VVGVNLDGVFFCTKYEIQQMLKNGGGSIINIASILGQVSFATAPAYVAAKHDVVGLTKTAGAEYVAAGIRVNAIGPAFISTPSSPGWKLMRLKQHAHLDALHRAAGQT
jgi:NAD(P)-dependent dehydrogenase (short-subunit alcohol dehydrogenase family)